jgi:ATP-dependent helicase/nuclease subunit B
VQKLAAPQSASQTRMHEWFEGLIEDVVSDHSLRDAARVTAREAARILGGETLDGPSFADWLRSLLGSVSVPHPDAGRGVAILAPEEISGRRYGFVFVMNAVDGAYRAGELEDFFVPEDLRSEVQALLRGVRGLPERLSGLEDSALYDVLTRADDAVYVSHPSAERGATLRPHPRLAQLGASVEADLHVTASALELAHATTRDALEELLEFHGVGELSITKATELERFAVCGIRAWAEQRLPVPRSGTGLVPGDLLDGWARRQRSNLWRGSPKTALEVAPDEHREILGKLSPAFRVQLEESVESRVPPVPNVSGIKLAHKDLIDGVEYVMDGVRFKPSEDQIKLAEIYRVVENAEDGYAKLMQDDRHREWWYAAGWLGRGVAVNLMVMDFHAAPKRPFDLFKPYAVARLEKSAQTLDRVQSDLRRGIVRASPGFHCGACAYRDLCRVAD